MSTQQELAHSDFWISCKANTKERVYPNNFKRLTFCTKKIFRDSRYTLPSKDKEDEEEKETKPKNMDNPTRADSVKRAKERAFDIAYLNEFEYFITWTLNGDLIDRYDPMVISKKLKKWLDNMVQRKCLMYLIIPEHHKDGAIHMHGLISGDIELIDSGKKDEQGHTIYNMPQWQYGFSTAIATYGDSEATACYMTKYITKDLKKIFGSFYYAGGGVKRVPETHVYNTEFRDITATEHHVEAANCSFKYVQIKDGEFVAK